MKENYEWKQNTPRTYRTTIEYNKPGRVLESESADRKTRVFSHLAMLPGRRFIANVGEVGKRPSGKCQKDLTGLKWLGLAGLKIFVKLY